eukprot:4997083-Prymnesium_polylepis.1
MYAIGVGVGSLILDARDASANLSAGLSLPGGGKARGDGCCASLAAMMLTPRARSLLADASFVVAVAIVVLTYSPPLPDA